MTDRWKSLVDRLLEDANESGVFKNLPGEGQPLVFEDESHIPEDMRMAHRLLKEHDLVPEWIMLAKDIDALRERLVDNMRRGLRAYRGALGDADRSQNFDRRQQIEIAWRRAQKAYAEQTDKLNREILRYNLKVPPGFPQLAQFDMERELSRLQDNTQR
jgi:hypothetical protein